MPVYDRAVVRVKDLKVGDWLDLVGDAFADINNDHPVFEREYMEIAEIDDNYLDHRYIEVREIGEEYRTSIMFPTDHYIKKVVEI